MKDGSYVKAKDQTRQGIAARVPDVWLGQGTDGDSTYYTLEIAPQYGSIAGIRLSTDELAEVYDLIGERLEIDSAAVAVEINVPMFASVVVNRT